ncbi:MAG: type III pantothenate kinase [Bacteroidota bacterium]
MNLVLDIGNTRIKAGLFEGSLLTDFKWFGSMDEFLKDSSFIAQAQSAIIGTVVLESEPFYKVLNGIMPTTIFTSETPIPIINKYASASTLGSDRLAASIGAFELYPNKDVLVIDAGTCIKYNFTNSANEYIGGAISPGLNMRFKAMHDYTSRLPLLEFDDAYNELIGKTTQGSILSGVINGSVAEIEGFIDLYKEQYPQLICVITGGDSERLAKRLKNRIFTHQNLVLKGLNYILNSTSLQ